jgi:hypothetical protein
MFQDLVMQLQWLQDLDEPTRQLEEWTYPYTHYLGQYEINFDANSEAGYIEKILKSYGVKPFPSSYWPRQKKSLTEYLKAL